MLSRLSVTELGTPVVALSPSTLGDLALLRTFELEIAWRLFGLGLVDLEEPGFLEV